MTELHDFIEARKRDIFPELEENRRSGCHITFCPICNQKSVVVDGEIGNCLFCTSKFNNICCRCNEVILDNDKLICDNCFDHVISE